MVRSLILALALSFFATPAMAEDDDFDFLDEEEDDDKEEAPLPEDEEGTRTLPKPDDEDDTPNFDELEEEDPIVPVQTEGMDTAEAYKAKQREVEGLSAEDESIAWEKYLRTYPNSQFRSRIEARMDKLRDEMYGGRIETEEEVEQGGLAEIRFAQPMTLENIDPRKKVRAGFEFGLPGYIAPILDFEWAFLRNLSAHAGVRGRYGGVSFEPGARYAIIKSARSNFLLTAIGDLRLNLNPAFLGVRPQLAVGKRFEFGEIDVDAQLQGGTELVTAGIFSPRVVGGANVSVAPNETVRFYFETSTYMKDLGWDQGGSFRFNVISFGLRFLERGKGVNSKYEAGAGAIAPYSSQYWSYHSGALALDFNYFL